MLESVTRQIAEASTLLLLLLASATCALEIVSWTPMEWKEYKPLPIVESGKDAFHVGKVISKSGLALKAEKEMKANAGDDFMLRAQAKGQGDAILKLKYLDKKGRWCGYSKQTAHIELQKNWSAIECIIPVEDTLRGKVEYVLPMLELHQGSELYLKECLVSIENNGIASSLPFPGEWNAFVFNQEMEDLDFPVDMIPEQIHANHWKLMTLEDGFIKFNTEFVKPRIRNNAVLYAYLYSPAEIDYTIGAGADFYMRMYINGECILDTMKEGNCKGIDDVHYDNYKVNAKLQKGQNLIVIHFQSGVSKYPRLTLCGPDTLKNMEKQLAVENYLTRGDPSMKTNFMPPAQPGANIEYTAGQSILAAYRPYIFFGDRKKAVFGLGMKLYSLSQEGHVLYQIGKDLSMKVRSNVHTGGLIVSVLHKGQELKNLRLPQEMLPSCLTFATNGKSYFINALGVGNEKLAFATGALPETINIKVDMKVDFVGCYAVAGDFFTAIMMQGKKKNKQ